MYTTFFRFFGLRDNPFNVNPDPEYLFLNEATQTVLDEIINALQARKGLVVLTGEAGTGKTTLVNQLKRWLKEEQTATAFIFNPHLAVDELFDLILADFGIDKSAPKKGSSLARINGWLLEQYRLGRNAVLFVDEAQGLPSHALEQIRMLLNHEMPQEQLLQIVLSGQPELEQRLKRPDMRQLRQRIVLRCYTKSLVSEEVNAYIQKRLEVSGGGGQNIFAPEAVEAIHLFSRGIPRVVNMLCEHAMIRAYARRTQLVSAGLIEEAAKQLQFDDLSPFQNWSDPDTRENEEPLYSLDDLSEPQATLDVQAIANEVAAIAATNELKTARASWLEVTAGADTDLQPTPVCLEGSTGEKNPEPILVSEFGTPHEVSSECKEALALGEYQPLPAVTPQPGQSGPRMIAVKRQSEKNQGWFDAMQRLWNWAQKCGKLAENFPWTSRDLWLNDLPLAMKSFSRISGGASNAWKQRLSVAWGKAGIYLTPQEWDKHFESLLRWLQQPIPTLKIHRRIDH